jgi:hypothetical protein
VEVRGDEDWSCCREAGREIWVMGGVWRGVCIMSTSGCCWCKPLKAGGGTSAEAVSSGLSSVEGEMTGTRRSLACS